MTAVRCVPAGTLATVQKAPRELTTSRLTLRPPGRGDRSLWVGLHRDPALYEHGVFAMPESDDAAAHDFTECLDRWESAGFDYGVVEETNTRRGDRGRGSTAARRRARRAGAQPLLPPGARGARPGPRERGGARLDRPRAGVAARPARRGQEPRGEPARPCRRRSPRAWRPWAPPATSPRGRPHHGAAGAAGRGARLVRRADPRVAARPVVLGERHRGSGRLPARRPAPPGRRALAAHEEGMADGDTTGVILRGVDRSRRGGRVLGRRPPTRCSGTAARPTGS